MIRVFPRRTSFTPKDPYAFVGDPPMWRPPADEVHISCTFTWDRDEAFRLRQAWAQYYPRVYVGGPAIARCDRDFLPGMYIKAGVTFTSRGCNNNCPWCLVPSREGKLRETKDFAAGHIINDNNLLQCSSSHIERVFDMLRSRSRGAVFSGGFESRLVNDETIRLLKSIRVAEVFLAADTSKSLIPLKEAVKRLEFLVLNSNKLRCYVLIGMDETLQEAERRLRSVWDIGCLPFSQLYQPPDKFIKYSKEWRSLNRTFSRPAATRTLMKEFGV